MRLLPSLAELPNDPDGDWFEELAGLTSGLILVTGPTGSGKTTALARLVRAISEKPLHIITIEDPAEYIFAGGAALIHQREAGRDTASFSSGVREALREDPDVIVIGEMRDEETIAAALTAAETGHLVLATMHDASAAGAAGRIVHAFRRKRKGNAGSSRFRSPRGGGAETLAVRREDLPSPGDIDEYSRRVPPHPGREG